MLKVAVNMADHISLLKNISYARAHCLVVNPLPESINSDNTKLVVFSHAGSMKIYMVKQKDEQTKTIRLALAGKGLGKCFAGVTRMMTCYLL